MITAGVVVALGLVVSSIVFGFRRRAGGVKDLGAVSHQWIAEHRLETSQHARRS